MRRLALAAIAAVAACGGSPATPSPATPPPATMPDGGLPFVSARYSLAVFGDSLRCGDIKSPQVGTQMWITFDLSSDASGWTGTTADNGLTIRFQRGSPSTRPLAIGLSGMARGSAEDEGLPFPLPGGTPPPSGIRITLSDPVPLSGEMPSPQISDFSNGSFDGAVVFSRNGVTATCPAGAVGWSMNRLR